MADVIVKIGAETFELKTGLANAKNDVKKFENEAGGMLAGFGAKMAAAFSVGAIISFGRTLIDTIGSIQDTADRLDISAEAVQGLSNYFSEGGAKAQDFDKGMTKLNQTLQDARDGNEKAIASFERLGVSWEDIRDKSPEQILYLIADGMKRAEDKTQALSAVMDVLGKSGAKLAPGLKEGSDAIKEYIEGISKYTNEEVKQVDQAWDDLVRTLKSRTVDAVHAVKAAWDAIGEIGMTERPSKEGETYNKPLLPKGSEPDYAAENPDPSATVDPRIRAKAEKDAKAKREAAEKAEKEGADSYKQSIAQYEREDEERARNYQQQLDKQKAADDKLAEARKEAMDATTEEEKRHAQARVEIAEKEAKDIKDAAVKYAMQTPEERRADRRAADKERRAQNRVDANERDLADRKRRGAHDQAGTGPRAAREAAAEAKRNANDAMAKEDAQYKKNIATISESLGKIAQKIDVK